MPPTAELARMVDLGGGRYPRAVASGDAIHLRAAVALLGAFPALAGADLDVATGEVALLQGANGAGKTTLLRVCAGIQAVVSGDVEVLGHDLVRDRRAVRRHVGLLGQTTGLYDDLSVADNVRFAVRAAGGDQSACAPALERLGLVGRLASAPVSRLSTGQRRRTALAVLAARRPPLWLLDEPHAGLDAEGRDLLDGLVREAVESGATVVLASHELDRATALADRVLAVAGGVIVADLPGPSGRLRRGPGPRTSPGPGTSAGPRTSPGPGTYPGSGTAPGASTSPGPSSAQRSAAGARLRVAHVA